MHHFADTNRSLQQDSSTGTGTEAQALGSAPKPARCLLGLCVTEHSSSIQAPLLVEVSSSTLLPLAMEFQQHPS